MAMFAAIVRLLVINARSRRAVDETVLDWKKELENVSSRGERLRCHLRSAVAMMRTLMLNLPREMAGGQIGSVLSRVAALTLIPAIIWLAFTGSFGRHPADPLPLTLLDAVRLNAWWFSIVLAFLLPFAWFLSTAWMPRATGSGIGLVFSGFLVSFAFTSLIGPMAAKHSYDAMWARQDLAWQREGVRVESPNRSSSTPTLLDTVHVVGHRDNREVLFVRVYTVVLPLLCASLVLLATVLPPTYRWQWALGVSVALAAQRLVPELLRTPGPLQLRSYFLDLLVFSYGVAVVIVGVATFSLLRREALASCERFGLSPKP